MPFCREHWSGIMQSLTAIGIECIWLSFMVSSRFGILSSATPLSFTHIVFFMVHWFMHCIKYSPCNHSHRDTHVLILLLCTYTQFVTMFGLTYITVGHVCVWWYRIQFAETLSIFYAIFYPVKRGDIGLSLSVQSACRLSCLIMGSLCTRLLYEGIKSYYTVTFKNTFKDFRC